MRIDSRQKLEDFIAGKENVTLYHSSPTMGQIYRTYIRPTITEEVIENEDGSLFRKCFLQCSVVRTRLTSLADSNIEDGGYNDWACFTTNSEAVEYSWSHTRQRIVHEHRD